MGRLAMNLAGAYKRVSEAIGERRAGTSDMAVNVSADQGNPNASVGDTSSPEAEHARKRTTPLDADVAAGAEYQKSLNICTKLPVFGVQYFETFEDFVKDFGTHTDKSYAGYRCDHSIGREAANTARIAAHAKAAERARKRGLPFTEPLLLIPESLSHSIMVFKCVHGCIQPKRGSGQKQQRRSRYFECHARITAEATYNTETDRWFAMTKNENRTHNHHCNLDTFITYMNSSEIPDPILRKTTIGMLSVHGKSRQILEKINEQMPFTRRQLDNFGSYRLGGGTAVEGMENLLSRFSEVAGNQVLQVKDQDGFTCGIAMQSAAQKVIFEEWGDNLILDWTHNTNNIGYYLGSLLVTTATGKGVSVFDFLCLTQSKDIMRVLFEHFVSTNAGAVDRVKSVVIDKDYREWQVLEEVFPNTSVVLCQFHVIKWFSFVVSMPKYALSLDLRVQILRCLSIMIYAAAEEDFSHQQQVISHLLAAKKHQLFLQYLNDRWYSCRRMWANYLRGDVFTASNTTSNRIESFWRQFKEDLGNRQRIDLCIEAIFRRAKTVLGREKDELVTHSASVSLHVASVSFLETLLRDLSDYTTALVQGQWNLYASSPVGAYLVTRVEAAAAGDASSYVVRVTKQRQVDFHVNTSDWTCSCHFSHGCLLPCRHLMYVADAVLEMVHYPAGTLARRWSISHAAQFVGVLVRTADELSTLRLCLLGDGESTEASPADRPHASNGGLGSVGHQRFDRSAGSLPLPSSKPFALVQLRRREVSDRVVMGDMEKHNIIATLFESLSTYLMNRGFGGFRKCTMELEEVVSGLLVKWEAEKAASRAEKTAAASVAEVPTQAEKAAPRTAKTAAARASPIRFTRARNMPRGADVWRPPDEEEKSHEPTEEGEREVAFADTLWL